MVNRVITGAHYGMRDWLAQRVTAAIMAVYTVIVAVIVLMNAPLKYAGWQALFAQGWMRVATLLFMLSLAWHAWHDPNWWYYGYGGSGVTFALGGALLASSLHLRGRLAIGTQLEGFAGVPVTPAFAKRAYDWLLGGRLSQQLGTRVAE